MGDAQASDSGDALCYIRNDFPYEFNGKVAVEIIQFHDGVATELSSIPVNLKAGAGTTAFFCPDGKSLASSNPNCSSFHTLYSKAPDCSLGAASCYLRVKVTAADPTNLATLSSNTLPLGLPSSFVLPKAVVNFTVTTAAQSNASIIVTTDNFAAYVWLSTAASGRFSENGFMLRPQESPKMVEFLSFGPLESDVLQSTLRVEHLGEYINVK